MKNYRIIGYDLNDQFVQVSYQDHDMNEPETLYLLDEPEGTELPLLLAYNDEQEKWLNSADHNFNEYANIHLIRNLYELALKNEDIVVEDKKYNSRELLFEFIISSLEKIFHLGNHDMETYIVFTVDTISEEAISLLQGYGEKMEIDRDKIFVQDYKESFYDYIWPQPREISNYDVILFGFRGHNMYAYKMSKGQISGSKRRDFVSIESDEIENITLDQVGDHMFEKFARSFFGRNLISSVFLVGNEFNVKWYNETLPFICNGRHVFQGKNLFSKGACYAALRKSGKRFTSLIYLDEFKIHSRVSIKVNDRGSDEWYPLVKQGENWYEINRTIEVLVDQVTSIQVSVDTIGKSRANEEIIPLDGLFDKQRRTCRLKIGLVMYSKDLCKIVIDDVDFGDIMKATGYHLEHMLSLNN